MIDNSLVTGFICECNPFHKGHKKILNYIKNNIHSKYIVAIITGNFVQRGEPAIYDKYTRTMDLLKNGVDLVIELPVEFSLSSADYFANCNIEIFDKLNFIDNIVFGSNICDIDILTNISKDLIKLENNKNQYKINLKNGFSHSKIISELINKNLSPNDILAVSYIKSIINKKSKILPICINRDMKLKGATEIREKIKRKNKNIITIDSFSDYLNQILFFNIKNNIDLSKYYCITDSLANAIKKTSLKNLSFSERTKILHKKNLTEASIKRALFHILLNMKENDIKKMQYGNKIDYIRILGFNKNFSLKNIRFPFIISMNPKGFSSFEKNFQKNSVIKNGLIKNKSLLTNIYASDLYFSVSKSIIFESTKKVIIY